MLTGQNGILTQAQNAKEETEESKDWEQVKLAVTSGKLENITDGTDLNTAIQNELRKTDSAATVTGETDEKEITYFGKVYNVNVETGATSGGEDAFQKPDYNDAMLSLKQKDYVLYDTGRPEVGENGKVLCQVLYEASSPYGLQIIPVECIKENGEYISVSLMSYKYEDGLEYDEMVSIAKSEYNSAIEVLNEKAMTYANDNYILDARCVGSNPINKNSENINTVKMTTRHNNPDTGEIEYGETIDTNLKDTDNNYLTDYENLEELQMLHMAVDEQYYGQPFLPYWLASRYNDEGIIYMTNTGIRFKLRSIDTEEYYTNPFMIGIYFTEGWIPYGFGVRNIDNLAFRPVFLLKGNLQITAGDGQEATPYELGI